MSTPLRSHDDEVVELSLRLAGLLVTVRGPPERASEALSLITGSLAGLGPSTAESENSFEVVSSAGDSSASGRPRVLESRDQVASTFASCPAAWISRAPRLGGSVSSGQFRIRRAWQAGQWARAVLDQRASSPNRSEPLDLRCRFYAVLRCEGLDCPVVFRSPGSYWSALVPSAPVGVPVLSATHLPDFASECEALVYLDSAGFSEPYVICGERAKCLDFAKRGASRPRCGALCSHMARWRRAGWNLGSKGPRSSPPERWTFVGCSQPRLFEVVLDGGRLNPTGSDLQCLVVDFQSHVVDLLRLPQSFENIAFSFDPDQPYALPDPGVLLPQVLEWIQSAEAGSGLEFYAAEGGLQGCSEDACQKSKSHAKARRWMPGPSLAPSAGGRESDPDASQDQSCKEPWLVAVPCFGKTPGAFGIGEGKARISRGDPQRHACSSGASPVNCFEQPGKPNCPVIFRPYGGFRGSLSCRRQGIFREGSIADRACESEGPLLSECDASHGPQNASHSSSGWGLPPADGQGGMWHKSI